MPTIVRDEPSAAAAVSSVEAMMSDDTLMSEVQSGVNDPQDCLPIRRWSRAEYHAMAEAGIFGVYEHVELIEGAIVVVSPKSVSHTFTTNLIYEEMRRIYGGHDCVARKEDPIVLDDGSEPEPDVAVARGSAKTYKTRQPGPADLLLIAEVSLATVRGDRAQKGRVYARAGVPEYWLVNLPERRIEVYRDPGLIGGEFGYRSITLLTEDQTISPIDVPDAAIPVRELLP
jgi:Uma2 family endonuclease